MWATEWVPWAGNNGMFVYNLVQWTSKLVGNTDQSIATGLGPLNLLIAPMYAWLYLNTGIQQYQLEGDTIWYAGVETPPSIGVNFTGKNYSQQYLWSYDYVTWRTATAPTGTPPAPATNLLGSLGVQ